MAIKLKDLSILEDMKRDFQEIGCEVSIKRGLKDKGYTENDIDLDIKLGQKKNLLACFSKIKKWNRIVWNKFDLFLDIMIWHKKKHIYDFDGRPPTFFARPWESDSFGEDGEVIKRDARDD
ncbi:MAG: hypothetical protein JSV51_03690 [Candidatus Bathyarchaeota archaeon]|nr:MAG: hypothetical protein JSV51_03690 [Candidatus Bathyarchaeota archaeon]